MRPIPTAFPPPPAAHRSGPWWWAWALPGSLPPFFWRVLGLPPIALERGRPVEQRSRDVSAFWAGGALDPASNVQFGEGGAGAFSDGKLTTGTHDPRLSAVVEALVVHGAPEDIRYSHKPHIGTDVLVEVVRNIRLELLRLGCDIRFEHRLSGLSIRGGVLTAVTVDAPTGPYTLETDALRWLRATRPGIPSACFLTRRPHGTQVFCSGRAHRAPAIRYQRRPIWSAWKRLPPSDYKLACHLPRRTLRLHLLRLSRAAKWSPRHRPGTL